MPDDQKNSRPSEPYHYILPDGTAWFAPLPVSDGRETVEVHPGIAFMAPDLTADEEAEEKLDQAWEVLKSLMPRVRAARKLRDVLRVLKGGGK